VGPGQNNGGEDYDNLKGGLRTSSSIPMNKSVASGENKMSKVIEFKPFPVVRAKSDNLQPEGTHEQQFPLQLCCLAVAWLVAEDKKDEALQLLREILRQGASREGIWLREEIGNSWVLNANFGKTLLGGYDLEDDDETR